MEDENVVNHLRIVSAIKSIHERYWFRKWEDVLDYIKEGNKVRNGENILLWDGSHNEVVFHHKVSDITDCTSWFEDSRYDEKTFLNNFKLCDVRVESASGGEYTYLDQWSR